MGTIPGVSSTRIRFNVQMTQERLLESDVIGDRKQYVPRRFRINKNDVESIGFTPMCLGCKALARNQSAINHSEDCRVRVEDWLRSRGDPRVQATYEKFREHQEGKRKSFEA